MPTLLTLSRFDESGAGPRYRVYQYCNELEKHRIHITSKPLLTASYVNRLYAKQGKSKCYLLLVYLKRALFLLRYKNKFDLTLMDGELFPFIPFFIEKWFLPKRFIMDQDDALWHVYDQHRSKFVRWMFGRKIDLIMRRGLHIVVGNDYTKSCAISAGAKKVTALPTVVDATKYKASPVRQKKDDVVILGWVGSPVTVHFLDLIKPALQKIAKQHNIQVHIIGAEYNIEGVTVLCNNFPNGWSESEEIKLTNEIDIGVMPLLDGAYEKGKCGFKLIKYMAFSKPVVASKVGMNVEIVEHDKTGYLAATPEEWEKYLLKLIQDKQRRKDFGALGREIMLKKYSLQATAPILVKIVLDRLAQ